MTRTILSTNCAIPHVEVRLTNPLLQRPWVVYCEGCRGEGIVAVGLMSKEADIFVENHRLLHSKGLIR